MNNIQPQQSSWAWWGWVREWALWWHLWESRFLTYLLFLGIIYLVFKVCTFLGGGGGACTALVFFSASLPEALSYLTWIYRLESVSDKIRKKWLHFSHCTKRVEAAKQKENNVKNIFLSNWSQIKSRYKALVNDSKNKRCWSASNNGWIKSKIQPQLTVCYIPGQLLNLSIVYVKTKIAKMSINIGNPKGKKCCLPMTALWYNIICKKKECEHFIRGSKHRVLIV